MLVCVMNSIGNQKSWGHWPQLFICIPDVVSKWCIFRYKYLTSLTISSFLFFQSKLNIQCLSSANSSSKVVNLQWYNGHYGYVYRDAPTLVICYDNGRMQIMRDESDDSKYKFLPNDTMMALHLTFKNCQHLSKHCRLL